MLEFADDWILFRPGETLEKKFKDYLVRDDSGDLMDPSCTCEDIFEWNRTPTIYAKNPLPVQSR